ncbi:bacterio-opsin activator domain-containing protein [Halomarina salina]|uniref:Bacterio-opsin activator domain-containing protein n=1 Tax=Halomarina salina TaxID=1872699 RepID=A0ABD5RJR7_9EURY|nr:bacterio-opsin activator domain-containing protein [Halomarina salina]
MTFDNLVAPTGDPTGSTDSTAPTDPTDADDAPDVEEEETSLVIEFTVAAEDFVLAETLDAVPEKTLEFEQFVPTSEELLPYLWATDSGMREFEVAATNDPTVESLRRVGHFGDGALYHVTWSDSADHLLTWLRGNDAVVLQTETTNDGWLVKLRVGSRTALGDLQSFCRDRDISFEVIRLYELTQPKMGQFNVSEKQRDCLLVALEMGFFDIPRGATLGDVADRLDISTRSASERLRRGQTNLLNNTLTIGEPTGVGVGEDI